MVWGLIHCTHFIAERALVGKHYRAIDLLAKLVRRSEEPRQPQRVCPRNQKAPSGGRIDVRRCTRVTADIDGRSLQGSSRSFQGSSRSSHSLQGSRRSVGSGNGSPSGSGHGSGRGGEAEQRHHKNKNRHRPGNNSSRTSKWVLRCLHRRASREGVGSVDLRA